MWKIGKDCEKTQLCLMPKEPREVCTFSSSMGGFSQGTLASSHCLRLIQRLIWDYKLPVGVQVSVWFCCSLAPSSGCGLAFHPTGAGFSLVTRKGSSSVDLWIFVNPIRLQETTRWQSVPQSDVLIASFSLCSGGGGGGWAEDESSHSEFSPSTTVLHCRLALLLIRDFFRRQLHVFYL